MTCSLGSNQVTGDAVASAAWLALPFYWRATTQQFRAQGYSVYSVIALDATNPDAVVLTLDRHSLTRFRSIPGWPTRCTGRTSRCRLGSSGS